MESERDVYIIDAMRCDTMRPFVILIDVHARARTHTHTHTPTHHTYIHRSRFVFAADIWRVRAPFVSRSLFISSRDDFSVPNLT